MTDTALDPEFGPAWIDVDEFREEPIPHRYIHGGFEGTTTRFRIRFPATEDYRGRMLQLLGGGQGGTEHLTDHGYSGVALDEHGRWVFRPDATVAPHRYLVEAARRGAFLVECNEGFRAGIDDVPADITLTSHRANAHAARYAIGLADEHYGRAPERRYLTGFSGGGNRTINALERTEGLFDGGVGGGIVTMELTMASWSIVAEAEHVLRDILDEVAENADAGGSGDLFAATRTDEQRRALAALYRAGYPLGNERGLRSGMAWQPGWHYLTFADPTYQHDFFHVPGYAGHDGLVEPTRGEATVVECDEARGTLRLDRDPADLVGAEIEVVEGPRAGSSGLASGRSGDDLLLFVTPGPSGVTKWEAGDRVRFDNSRWLALRHYHLDAARRPPVRYAASMEYTGELNGKFLLVQTAADHLALTNTGDAYVRRVADPESFRVWWIENADHAGPGPGAAAARYVDFAGALTQALDDLIAWVEEGVEPPPSTRYTIDADGVLRMPETAAERRGIQPTVMLEANGSRRVTVRRGESVVLRATAEAPAGSEIVEVAWDPAGVGAWEAEPRADGSVVVERDQVYPEPGVVLAGVRVRSRRPGSQQTVDNLSHARIVVE
jgi:hypothetical protein